MHTVAIALKYSNPHLREITYAPQIGFVSEGSQSLFTWDSAVVDSPAPVWSCLSSVDWKKLAKPRDTVNYAWLCPSIPSQF